jgi:hypothetical protein
MNIIRHPIASFAEYHFKLCDSVYYPRTFVFKACLIASHAIRVAVMPVFLAIELVYKQIPLHLTLQFSANQQQIDESKENIKKLVDAILCPFYLLSDLICDRELNDDQRFSLRSSYMAFCFMDPNKQESFILETPYLFVYASNEVKNNRNFVLPFVRNYPDYIDYLPQHLKIFASYDYYMRYSSSENYTINDKRYLPKALSPELRAFELPDLPENASIEHLKGSLLQFIDDLSRLVAQDEGKLALLKNELGLKQNTNLEACIAKLREYHTTLFNRLENKIAYLGTPQAGSQELVQFYEQIEFHLRHLDAFFSKDENRFPEALVERVQLLQTQSACGARFQGELEQLFSLNCLSFDTMSLNKQLAIIASLEAKKVIEAITPNRDVHDINIKMFQLNQFLVGNQVTRDQLGNLFNSRHLFFSFFSRHTSKNLVEVIQRVLKLGSELEVSFTDYLKENFLLELTENEIAEIPIQAQEYWEENKSVKIQRFKEFLKAKAENNQQRMRFINLPQEEASCADVEEYKQLLETKKNSYVEVISEGISKDKQINKLYAEYFDGNPETGQGSMKWKPSIIAMALKKMGILEEINRYSHNF